ncbi:hypothetical protein Tco_0550782 [Tanacetum coccineum]
MIVGVASQLKSRVVSRLYCFVSLLELDPYHKLDEDEEIADLFGELHQSYEGVVFQINDQEEPKDLFVELDHVADLVVDEEVAEKEKNVVDETEVKGLVGGGESIYGHVQIERQKREKKERPKRFGRRRQLKMIVNDEFALIDFFCFTSENDYLLLCFET